MVTHIEVCELSSDEERRNFGTNTWSDAGQTNEPGASFRAPVSASSARDKFCGTVLAGRYTILEVVGQGGMGVVYKAKQELLDRLVAIKMLRSQFITDETSVKRFKYEAKAACKLSHPHVITVFDFGMAESGEPYIVMEYLTGTSLADVVGKGQNMPYGRALGIFAQVCDALDHAHSQGMIHRDLKPGNIMLISNQNQQDFVKVVDFGIAKLVGTTPTESQKLTQTGEIFGSPVYMSPEQCRGEELGPPSDIYGMGIVMYETLMGRLPFAGSNIVETITQHLCSQPPAFSQVRPDLQIPEAVEALVMKCLRKEPSLRYASMGELMYDIKQIVGPAMGMRPTAKPTEEMAAPRLVAQPLPMPPARPAESRSESVRSPAEHLADTPTRARRAAGNYYPPLSGAGGPGRMRPRSQWEPVAEKPRQSTNTTAIVAVAAALAVVAASAAAIWAFTSGMFTKHQPEAQSKPTTASGAGQSTTRQNTATPVTTSYTVPPAAIVPSNMQVSAGQHTIAGSFAARQASSRTDPLNPPSRKPTAVSPSDRHSNAPHSNSARRPETPHITANARRQGNLPANSHLTHTMVDAGSNASTSLESGTTDDPLMHPNRHHFQADDPYGSWSSIRQLESGK